MTTRYNRQTVLPEIGQAGQILLGQARILVVGAGGLGSPILLYLTAAGVGRRMEGGCIGIIDDDDVDTSNLQRQIIYTEADQGRPKAVAAAEHLQALNHEINFVIHKQRLSIENISELFLKYDLVIDGADNFATKYLINDAAVKTAKPVVYGSIMGFEGQVTIFSAVHGPCYRCLYPEQATSYTPNCAEAGTIGSIAGVIGSIQALEACKLALGEAHCQHYGLEPLIGRLLLFDARTWDTRILILKKSATCPLCNQLIENPHLENAPQELPGTSSIQTISLSDLNDLYEAGVPLTLVDVREPIEWETNHLSGAIHIPLGQLLTENNAISCFEKNTLVVVYCEQGIRSLQAAHYLANKGFNPLNLRVTF